MTTNTSAKNQSTPRIDEPDGVKHSVVRQAAVSGADDLTARLLDPRDSAASHRAEDATSEVDAIVVLHPTDSESSGSRKSPEPNVLHSGHGGGGGSVASAVFNLTTTSVGAGIMALPATMKVTGVPLGILGVLFLGWLTDFALNIIVRTSVAGRHKAYGQLMGSCYGRGGRVLAQVFVMLQAFGSLIVYLIITGDVLSGSNSGTVHHTGLLEELAGGPTWWNARAPVLLAVLLVLLLPLVSLSRIDSLMTSSAVSVVLAVVFVVFTIVACVTTFLRGDLEPPRLLPDLSTGLAVLRTFTTLPVMANAYICHYNVQPIYEELKDKSEKNMCRVAYLSQITVTTIYLGAATSSYLLFGDATASDVLANFDADLGLPKVASDIVRVGYVIHLLLVFPIVHFPLRLTLDFFLFPKASRPLSRDPVRFGALTAILLALIFFCAIVVPDIYILFSFLGALVSVSIGFTFPALIALKSDDCVFARWERCVAWFMLALGVYLTVSGFVAETALLQ